MRPMIIFSLEVKLENEKGPFQDRKLAARKIVLERKKTRNKNLEEHEALLLMNIRIIIKTQPLSI